MTYHVLEQQIIFRLHCFTKKNIQQKKDLLKNVVTLKDSYL